MKGGAVWRDFFLSESGTRLCPSPRRPSLGAASKLVANRPAAGPWAVPGVYALRGGETRGGSQSSSPSPHLDWEAGWRVRAWRSGVVGS